MAAATVIGHAFIAGARIRWPAESFWLRRGRRLVEDPDVVDRAEAEGRSLSVDEWDWANTQLEELKFLEEKVAEETTSSLKRALNAHKPPNVPEDESE